MFSIEACSASLLSECLIAPETLLPTLSRPKELKLTLRSLQSDFHRVHKALLLNSGDKFEEMIEFVQQLNSGVINFGQNVDSKTFKQFISYLYTKQILTFNPYDTFAAKVTVIKDMVQLFAFAETYDVRTDFRNKLVDIVQDGFLAINSISKTGIISNIYKTTQPNSKLRKFASFFLLNYLRSPDYTDDESLNTFLGNNKDALDDFVEAVRFFEPGRDPRVRDCGGDPKCIECYHNPRYLDGKVGVHPCQFHTHKYIGPFKEMKFKVENGVQVYEEEDDGDNSEPQHEQCHLFMPEP
jgi:hypothetical protein